MSDKPVAERLQVKRDRRLAVDLDRDTIRLLAPAYGLDTVSQIAIDDDWSVLRFKRVQSIR